MATFADVVKSIAVSAVREERTNATGFRTQQIVDAAAGTSAQVTSVNGSSLAVEAVDGSTSTVAATTKVLRKGDPTIIFGGRAM